MVINIQTVAATGKECFCNEVAGTFISHGKKDDLDLAGGVP